MKNFKLIFALALILFSARVFGQIGEIEVSNENPRSPVFILNLKKKLQIQDTLELRDRYFIVRERVGVISKTPVSAVYGTSDGQQITLTPTTPLGWGLDFQVMYIENGDTLFLKYQSPKKNLNENRTIASVVTTYPNTDTLPRNILFFHVRFNTPMVQDIRAYEHVRLFKDDGEEIPNIWRHKTFWLDEGHILVLMVHPGRVKRGIKMDVPFLENQTYILKLDAGLKSVNGTTVAETDLKTFSIVHDDYQIPSILFTNIGLPKVNSVGTLMIEFSEGMDYSSIVDGVKIYCDEKRVTGTFTQIDSDLNYQFHPDQEWVSGKYSIIFEKKVCDFSGNRLRRPFEIQIASDIEKDEETVSYLFTL
jgi:hypothetical protein